LKRFSEFLVFKIILYINVNYNIFHRDHLFLFCQFDHHSSWLYYICAVYIIIIAWLHYLQIPSRVAICRGKKCCFIWVCYTALGLNLYNHVWAGSYALGACLITYLDSYIADYDMYTHSAYDFMCNITLYDVKLAYKNEKHSTKNHLNATFKSRKYDWERVFFLYYTYSHSYNGDDECTIYSVLCIYSRYYVGTYVRAYRIFFTR